MTVIEIEVIHDFVCAWCYIGKRNLDRAISLYQKTHPGGRSDTFSIKWRPYYLNYNPHVHSVHKSELMGARLSEMTPEQRTTLFNRMNRIGRSVGINFKGGRKIRSTRDAHRLVYDLSQASTEPSSPSASETQQKTNALTENIFEAYHELEKDISDKDVLRELAEDDAVGISRTEVDGWLSATDMAADVVDEETRKNKDVLNSGVPVYIIQGIHRIDGSGDPSEFLEIFAKVKERELQ